MLKLGRSQGVAIAAAVGHSVPVHEYAPMKIKMAITGQGQASKEQVADMLKRLLRLNADQMPKLMDATDALGVAYCHFMQQGRPVTDTHYNGWKDFINKNQNNNDKVSLWGERIAFLFPYDSEIIASLASHYNGANQPGRAEEVAKNYISQCDSTNL